MVDSKIINAFKELNLYDESFFRYINAKVKVLPFDVPITWFGCFPILNNKKIVDIKLLVPEIKTEENLLVNIHEFYHAYELYNELGSNYNPDVLNRENRAKKIELEYKKTKPI